MKDKWDLEQLKQNYNSFQQRYTLPSFEKLNEDFHIEKVADNETDFVLREIRACITEKFLNYLRFIESLINPSNAPMFIFVLTKTLAVKDKEKLIELYKKIAKIEVDLIELDLDYSEKKEADAIKNYFGMWQEMKIDFMEIVNVIKKNWDAKSEIDNRKYFG